MKRLTIPQLAFLIQKYEGNLQLVSSFLFQKGYASPFDTDWAFAALVVDGARANNVRIGGEGSYRCNLNS
jgi:hypothetical protein